VKSSASTASCQVIASLRNKVKNWALLVARPFAAPHLGVEVRKTLSRGKPTLDRRLASVIKKIAEYTAAAG
jgi:hypothetical protein